MTIPMTAAHCALIRAGTKTTTLRSTRYRYERGEKLQCGHGVSVQIVDRWLMWVTEDALSYDFRGSPSTGEPPRFRDCAWVAHTEGYETWAEVIAALRKLRHKLPKQMWLYGFEVVP